MSTEKEPSVIPSRKPHRLGRLSLGHFVELPNGELKRLPTTMLRPLTWREAILHRPATSNDIIGPEEVARQADERRELNERFNHDDDQDGIE